MALTSMTGYGRGESSVGGLRVEIELSSVNRKQLDVRLNLPRQLASLESRVHESVHKACSRGQVSGVVRMSTVAGEQAAEACVDEKLAQQYLRRLRRTARKLGVDDKLSAADLARMPGVLSCEARQDEPARMWPTVRKALHQALEELVAMREREGAALEKDIARRLSGLKRHQAAIAKRAPLLVKRYRKALLDRLKEAEVELDRSTTRLTWPRSSESALGAINGGSSQRLPLITNLNSGSGFAATPLRANVPSQCRVASSRLSSHAAALPFHPLKLPATWTRSPPSSVTP